MPKRERGHLRHHPRRYLQRSDYIEYLQRWGPDAGIADCHKDNDILNPLSSLERQHKLHGRTVVRWDELLEWIGSHRHLRSQLDGHYLAERRGLWCELQHHALRAESYW